MYAGAVYGGKNGNGGGGDGGGGDGEGVEGGACGAGRGTVSLDSTATGAPANTITDSTGLVRSDA